MMNEGYHKALELLRQAQTDHGFVASPDEHDNYKRIWTRDGVVTGLAALLSGENDLIQTFHATIETIFDHQHSLGFMPSNVSTDGKSSYGGTVGRADNPSWAVIGLCQYHLITKDLSLATRYASHVEKCFHVLDIWEFNGKHLVYVPQSGDWADEYIYHGYLLFDQLLRVWALRLAANVFEREDWREKAEQIRRVIEINFRRRPNLSGGLYALNLNHQMERAPENFWLMGFNPSRIYSQFDLQANALALFLNIGGDPERDQTLAFIKSLLENENHLIPSFHPAILDSDADMSELVHNFAYKFRNYPYEFHNGGLWPVWNGFLASALVARGQRNEAETLTRFIHSANRIQNWDFNECLHGKSKTPIGVRRCTWSAAGAVIAERSVAGSQLL